MSQVTALTEYAAATSQNGGLSRNGCSGLRCQLRNFWDANIIDLANTEGEIGQFYSVVRLYENTDDPEREIVVNPYGETVRQHLHLVDIQPARISNTPAKVWSFPFRYVGASGRMDAPLTEDKITSGWIRRKRSN